MWFLLVVILYINPQTGGVVVEKVHLSKTFASGAKCRAFMNSTSSYDIPPFHNLGCVKWGGRVV